MDPDSEGMLSCGRQIIFNFNYFVLQDDELHHDAASDSSDSCAGLVTHRRRLSDLTKNYHDTNFD